MSTAARSKQKFKTIGDEYAIAMQAAITDCAVNTALLEVLTDLTTRSLTETPDLELSCGYPVGEIRCGSIATPLTRLRSSIGSLKSLLQSQRSSEETQLGSRARSSKFDGGQAQSRPAKRHQGSSIPTTGGRGQLPVDETTDERRATLIKNSCADLAELNLWGYAVLDNRVQLNECRKELQARVREADWHCARKMVQAEEFGPDLTDPEHLLVSVAQSVGDMKELIDEWKSLGQKEDQHPTEIWDTWCTVDKDFATCPRKICSTLDPPWTDTWAENDTIMAEWEVKYLETYNSTAEVYHEAMTLLVELTGEHPFLSAFERACNELPYGRYELPKPVEFRTDS